MLWVSGVSLTRCLPLGGVIIFLSFLLFTSGLVGGLESRFEYAARTAPYENQRVDDFGAHHYPPGAPHPPPHAGGSVNFEEAWDRQGLPPPPPPPMPHGGAGPHAAAFQVTYPAWL